MPSMFRETQYIQDMYGSSVHGRQTLIARRLLERGVRYVQLWHGAANRGTTMARSNRTTASLPATSTGQSQLMTDLKQRGMFEDTLIIWGGEFGTPHRRTERRRQISTGPRPQSLWIQCLASRWRVRGGTVYGAHR